MSVGVPWRCRALDRPAHPAIIVIAQNRQRIGELAVERLLERLDGDRTPKPSPIVPTELIARGSGAIGPHA